MAFGFPAHHVETCNTLLDPQELHEVIAAIFNSFAWSVREVKEREVVGATTMNMTSWGERITISFASGNSITVTSKCALPTQCFDWGKNQRNVRKFVTEFQRRL